MPPEPMSEAEIWDEINSACERMTVKQSRLWEVIKIMPEKWHLSPWGDTCGGFWVVAIIGQSVILYNEIEEGFNRSSFATFGKIDEYWCNQDELEESVQQVINAIETGRDVGYKCSPPS